MMSKLLKGLLMLALSTSAAAAEKLDLWYLIVDAKNHQKVLGYYHLSQAQDKSMQHLSIESELRAKLLMMNVKAETKSSAYYDEAGIKTAESSASKMGKTSQLEGERTAQTFRLLTSKGKKTKQYEFPSDSFDASDYELLLPVDTDRLKAQEELTQKVLFLELATVEKLSTRYGGSKTVQFNGGERRVQWASRQHSKETQELWLDDDGTILAQLGKRASLILSDKASAMRWKHQ